ncbi:MAG TPA: hypothetical protein VMC79_02895 [Rectinemataceae bacterium]|nr:hypothetical protein [Rectinemataceae bacterium]
MLRGKGRISGYAAPAGTDTLSLTHGLFMAGLWSVATAAVAALLRCDARTSVVLGLAVFSHWILDFVTHPMGAVFGGKPLPPDLPLFFAGSSKVGLGLYNGSYAVAVAFDLGLTLGGIAAYVAYRRFRSPGGTAP